MSTLTHARYVSREEMAEVLRSLARLGPSNEGLGGHAPLEAFLEVAKRARELLGRYTA